jgi:hypothetical protein
MDPRSKRNILVGAGVVVALVVGLLLTIGQDNIYLWLAGIPAGIVVGAISHEYAPTIRDGLFAGGLGAILVALLITAEGFYRSYMWGLGFDSWVSFGGAAKGVWGLIAIGPAIAFECVLVAAVVHEMRVRRGVWSKTDEGNGNGNSRAN